MSAESMLDLRGFLQNVKDNNPRDYLEIDEALSAEWEIAACTAELERMLRVPLIKYTNIENCDYNVVQNVCSSLARIARSLGISVTDLEDRIEKSYDNLIVPITVDMGPVRENIIKQDSINLFDFPQIRYSADETHGYLSGACVVAYDKASQSQNLSFNRLMISSDRRLVIYMTPGSHLDTIFQNNRKQGYDTPVAAFIGSHPLWSLGSLAAGKLELDEYSVIGGLLAHPLEVVKGLEHPELLIPAHAEFSVEGLLKHDTEELEGPYGEAFGFMSKQDSQPVFEVSTITHRDNPLFQDIVPGHQEHMIMTSVAIRAHLNRTLKKQYSWIREVHLPAPMMAYISVSAEPDSQEIKHLIEHTLQSERFLKIVCVFDESVAVSNAKQTQTAIACHVRADKDMVVIEGLVGNGLDPSEQNGKTTKWGMDATATTVKSGEVKTNKIPESILKKLAVPSILKKAIKNNM